MSLNFLEKTVAKTDKRSHHTRDREIKQILEALLFSSHEAISLAKFKEIISISFPIQIKEIEETLQELKQEYLKEGRAFQIDEIGGGYLLRTIEEMHPYIELLHQDRRGEKLSRAATEVLAIIAYRQPITRREIEDLRGVDSSGTVTSLLERGLIEPVGRKETLGRPVQFGITKLFLQHFGLKDLQELVT